MISYDNNFKVELLDIPVLYDLSSLRAFYTPLIKSQSINFYSFLLDQVRIDNDPLAIYSVRKATSQISATISELNNSRKILEAVGLLKTYCSNDGKSYVFKLLKPLTASQFKKNGILSSKLTKAIGDVEFEQLLSKFNVFEIPKDNFSDISLTYYDVFAVDVPENNSSKNTRDILLSGVLSLDKAIDVLKPIEFILYLTSKDPNSFIKSGIMSIKHLHTYKSINTIIDYSYKVNNKIIINHIIKIANDLRFNKNINTTKEIKDHLINALHTKNIEVKLESTTTNPLSREFDSLENIFSSFMSDVSESD